MNQGLVGEKTLYADSTHLKANANKRKYDVEQVPVSPGAYVAQLNETVELDRKPSGKKLLTAKDEAPDTKSTKVSRTDADVSFMVRDEMPKGVFYLDHRTAGSKHNIIVDTHATLGNLHDSQPMIKRIDRIFGRFDDITSVAIGLDAKYFTAPMCHELEARQLFPVVGGPQTEQEKSYFAKREYL